MSDLRFKLGMLVLMALGFVAGAMSVYLFMTWPSNVEENYAYVYAGPDLVDLRVQLENETEVSVTTLAPGVPDHQRAESVIIYFYSEDPFSAYGTSECHTGCEARYSSIDDSYWVSFYVENVPESFTFDGSAPVGIDYATYESDKYAVVHFEFSK